MITTEKAPRPIDIDSLKPYWADTCEKASGDPSCQDQAQCEVVFDQTVGGVQVKGVKWDGRDWLELHWKWPGHSGKGGLHLWEIGISECRNLDWLLAHLAEKVWVTPESLFLVSHVWDLFHA